MDADLRVDHVPEEHVYELVLTEEPDEQVAGYAEYVPKGGAMAITHGRGLAAPGREGVRHRPSPKRFWTMPGSGVWMSCPSARSSVEHVRRNPDYLELVPRGQRRRFGLAA